MPDWIADLEAEFAADEREDRRLARKALRAGQGEWQDCPRTFEGWADLGVIGTTE